MSTPEYRVISIGTLTAHPLWEEKGEVRTGHTTTTLITAGEANIIVNPGLPATVLAARLGERTPVCPDDVTHVFFTTFSQEHYRGANLFEHATLLIHEPERHCAALPLVEQKERAEEAGDDSLAAVIDEHLSLLHRCQDAEDRLVPGAGVDLFPLPGVSPGTCGLLLPLPTATVLICGDAVATVEHLQQGAVLPTCLDMNQAQDSFREAIEIADILIPGRDNAVPNPVRPMMG